MAEADASTSGAKAQPNEWYHRQAWRELFLPHDETQAHQLALGAGLRGAVPDVRPGRRSGAGGDGGQRAGGAAPDCGRVGPDGPGGGVQSGAAASAGAAGGVVVRVDGGGPGSAAAGLGGAGGVAGSFLVQGTGTKHACDVDTVGTAWRTPPFYSNCKTLTTCVLRAGKSSWIVFQTSWRSTSR